MRLRQLSGFSRLFRALSGTEHRRCRNIAVGVKLLGLTVLSFFAFGTRTPIGLLWLTAINLTLLLVFRYGFDFLRREIKVFLWQTAMIVFLYILRFGWVEGFKPGVMISWQLSLTYMPGVIFVKTTPQSRIVEAFSAVAPYRAAFVMATCLKFIPLILTEIRNIYEGQVFRGAKILRKDLLNPFNWPDVVFCLVLPVIIRSMNLAGEITLAAKARNFGLKKRRTSWPGV
ncbi:MAG: energy-coupling factor transporter transmembrane component T [Desulfobacterales bacterium]